MHETLNQFEIRGAIFFMGTVMNINNNNGKYLYKPLHSIDFVDNTGLHVLQCEQLTEELVGCKAFGLACIPQHWTLPFFVVSKLFIDECRLNPCNIKDIILAWMSNLNSGIEKLNIPLGASIIIRSSACHEDIEERGQLISRVSSESNLEQDVSEYVEELLKRSLRQQDIPLVIQLCPRRVLQKGHLSNERRCYPEIRDWMVELDSDGDVIRNNNFSINLRKWRKAIDLSDKTNQPLACKLSIDFDKVLTIPAWWGYERKKRLHFEWIWDGYSIFLVQADQVAKKKGENPYLLPVPNLINNEYKFKVLRSFSKEDIAKYGKLRNVDIYTQLNLPTVPLYILDYQKISKSIINGRLSDELKKDIMALVAIPLIIRCDSSSKDLASRQMLPRTDTISEYQDVEKWLLKTANDLINKNSKCEYTFIFHSFIPAHASAFVYASPDDRYVEIECLYGLPEGLYYFSHDKIRVDTVAPKAQQMLERMQDFSVQIKKRYKKFAVFSDLKGIWSTKEIAEPYDWRPAISDQNLLKRMAYESRRIAEVENKALSVMWFVGVSKTVSPFGAMPWYHEPIETPPHLASLPVANVGLSNIVDVIRTYEDIEKVFSDIRKTPQKRVRIQPMDSKLLRDPDTLKMIGQKAKDTESTLILEGGVLSHAYYQLCKTGVHVESACHFRGFEDHHKFFKLVRDKIPSQIFENGECVRYGKLTAEARLRALKDKLIEEVYEVADSMGRQSMIEELADVLEVVTQLTEELDVSLCDIQKVQSKKKAKRGGFSEGLVLVETSIIPPSEKKDNSLTPDLVFTEIKDLLDAPQDVDVFMLSQKAHKVHQWKDKLNRKNVEQLILRSEMPVARDEPWNSKTSEIVIRQATNTLHISGSIEQRRIGNRIVCDMRVLVNVEPTLPLDLTGKAD